MQILHERDVLGAPGAASAAAKPVERNNDGTDGGDDATGK
jgi:hypothetical protein